MLVLLFQQVKLKLLKSQALYLWRIRLKGWSLNLNLKTVIQQNRAVLALFYATIELYFMQLLVQNITEGQGFMALHPAKSSIPLFAKRPSEQ